MSNLFELTEAELSVDVNNVKHFTQENVDILDSLRSKAAHPRIYGSKAPKGIKYINTQLIDVKDIDSDNEGFNQGARVSANEALDSIRSDITSNGYSLTELERIGAASPQWEIKNSAFEFKADLATVLTRM